MRDRRCRLGWLVGFVVLAALPRTGAARITFVQEEGIEDGDIEYDFVGDLVVSPDGNFVYAATAYSPNQIVVYARVSDTGGLDERAVVDPMAREVTFLAISPDGAHIYGLDYVTGEVIAFARNATTGLLTRLGSVQPPTSGINQQWQGITVSPDGAHVYATAAGRDSIGVYARDGSTGLLTLVEVESSAPGLSRPIGIAVSPDGAHVYVACFHSGGGVVVLARDAITGELSGVQDIENGSNGNPLSLEFSIVVSPDGAHVYVSGNPGITVFTRDAGTGVLSGIQSTIDGADHEVLLTADGSRAYACGSASGVRGYARNAATGLLTLDEVHLPGEEGFGPPLFCFGMAMTSNGRSFYTSTTYDLDLPTRPYASTVGVFRRLNSTCTAAPLAGCRTPTRPASIALRGGSGRLSWKWRGTGALADFGNPVSAANDAAICVYDDRGVSVRSVAPGAAPCPNDRPCWRLRSTSDIRYTNTKSSRDGLKLVKLQERTPGDVRLGVEARGNGLAVPPFPMVGPVTVQLQLSDGTTTSCWTSTFSTPRKNDFVLYRATSDP
jgi:6-phosphogluconolactonase (cycloisomerase 2 family)